MEDNGTLKQLLNYRSVHLSAELIANLLDATIENIEKDFCTKMDAIPRLLSGSNKHMV